MRSDGDADDGHAGDLAGNLREPAFLEPRRALAGAEDDDDAIRAVLGDRVENDWLGASPFTSTLASGMGAS